MEIHYKREMKRNYLVVEPEPGTQPGYEARMLANNSIDGLLRFHIKYMDERQSYYYDITSMQPLSRLLQNRFIDRGEICQLLIELHVALVRMEEYLLSEDGLLLDPDYIYVKTEGFQTGLCLVPGHSGHFPEALTHLLQYLMKKVDHKDKESVVLAYGMYQESLKENYGIEDLMKLVQREKGTEGEEKAVSGDDEMPEKEALDWVEYSERAEHGATKPAERGATRPAEHGATKPAVHGGPRPTVHGAPGPAELWGKDSERPAEVWKTETGGDSDGEERLPLKKQAAFGAVLSCAVPALAWFLRGPAFLKRYGPLFALLSIATAVLIAVWDIFIWKLRGGRGAAQSGRTKETGEEPAYRWEIPEEEDEGKLEEQICEEETDFQTVLLAGAPEQPQLHRLQAVTAGEEDIPIAYFPFVIGKHEELVDYVLNRSTVSRLHMRIDREGDEYKVTDLNSTNGTIVDGTLLEANETVKVKAGDEICIADMRYIFH